MAEPEGSQATSAAPLRAPPAGEAPMVGPLPDPVQERPPPHALSMVGQTPVTLYRESLTDVVHAIFMRECAEREMSLVELLREYDGPTGVSKDFFLPAVCASLADEEAEAVAAGTSIVDLRRLASQWYEEVIQEMRSLASQLGDVVSRPRWYGLPDSVVAVEALQPSDSSQS